MSAGEYDLRRAAEERAKAKIATNPVARSNHLTMARIFELRAEAKQDEPDPGPASAVDDVEP